MKKLNPAFLPSRLFLLPFRKDGSGKAGNLKSPAPFKKRLCQAEAGRKGAFLSAVTVFFLFQEKKDDPKAAPLAALCHAGMQHADGGRS